MKSCVGTDSTLSRRCVPDFSYSKKMAQNGFEQELTEEADKDTVFDSLLPPVQFLFSVESFDVARSRGIRVSGWPRAWVK